MQCSFEIFYALPKIKKKNIHSPQKIFKTKSPRDTLGAREFFSWRSCDCERTTRGQNMKNLHFLRCTTYCKLYIVLYGFWRDQKIHLQNISKQKFTICPLQSILSTVVIGSRQQLLKINHYSVRVGMIDIKPVKVVRNLGAWFDSHFSMSTHISKSCSAAFFFGCIIYQENQARFKRRAFYVPNLIIGFGA